jgi:hypothetical protein
MEGSSPPVDRKDLSPHDLEQDAGIPPRWRGDYTTMSGSDAAVKDRMLQTLTHPAVAAAIVAATLTALLYGGALTLPLFSDDLVQIPWLESITWSELWTSPSPYDYYRPVWYSLWRIWGALAGGLNPLGLHLLNVLAHFAASWLAGLLATTWIVPPPGSSHRRRFVGCLATALFAAFPFARQAVAWPGAVYNPLVSAMAAGTLLAYDHGRRGLGRGWFGLALLLATLSALTYEAGLLVAPLVTVGELAGLVQGRWERRGWWRWPLAFAGLFVALLALWRTMRGAGAAGFGLNPTDLLRNVAYLVQGLTYPVAPLAQKASAWLGLGPETCLWLTGAPVLALLIWSGLRCNRGALLLGLGWFTLFALPPLASMEAGWFALAPRFLYMTAAGAALTWTLSLIEPLMRLRPLWRTGATVMLLAILLTPAGLFVRDGIRLYGMAGESIWDAAEAARQDHPLLLVNLPLRVAPSNRVYPLGFEGVTPLPARVRASDLVLVHTGIADAAQAVSFGVVAPELPPDYVYELYGTPVGWQDLGEMARRAETVYLTRYEPGRIYLMEAGAVGEKTSSDTPLATFSHSSGEGGQLSLMNAAPTCDKAGHVRLTLTWQAETDISKDVTLFAHLMDPQGTLVAQADGYPLLGMQPFWVWKPGETVRDERYFGPATDENLTIRLGIWELATQEHWQAEGHPDGVVQLSVRCYPSAGHQR